MPHEVAAVFKSVVKKKEEAPRPRTRDGAGWYYAATFLAIVGLESIPRFTFELQKPLMIPERFVLMLIFMGLTWFFTYALHDEMRWGVLSSMFFADAIITAFLAVVLVAQVSVAVGTFAVPVMTAQILVYLTFLILTARAVLFSYLVSHRLTHLRTLVFCMGVAFLLAGEFFIIFGNLPF